MVTSDSLAALYDSLTAQPPNRPGAAAALGAVHQLWDPLRALPKSLRNLYHHEFVNRGQIVFLTTFMITMAGCGLLSLLLRRKPASKPSQYKRLPTRKRVRNSGSKTPTSSSSEDDFEDEEYDSNGSLRHGTDPKYPPKDWSSEPQTQTSDGMWIFFENLQILKY